MRDHSHHQRQRLTRAILLAAALELPPLFA
jgi:hypothetical protein